MKKAIFMCMVVIVFLVANSLIFAGEEKIELTEDQVVLLHKLEEQGLLLIKPTYNEAIINPDLWAQMNIMQKENISAAIAVYCGNFKGKNTYWAVIYDLQSGKKLAKYSRAWGFKVY